MDHLSRDRQDSKFGNVQRWMKGDVRYSVERTSQEFERVFELGDTSTRNPVKYHPGQPPPSQGIGTLDPHFLIVAQFQ